MSYSGARAPKQGSSPAIFGMFRRMLREVDADVDALPEGTIVVHGAEPTGVDMRAARRAERRGLVTEAHPADWAAYGNAAGMIRNKYVETVDSARFFIAPYSRGTLHALGLATKAGISTVVNRYSPIVVSSAPYSYRGADRLDVTRSGYEKARKAKDPRACDFLAPSAGLVYPAVEAMNAERATLKEGARIAAAGKASGNAAEVERGRDVMADAQARLDATWAAYEPAYLTEMRASYKGRRAVWDALLEAESVTVVCMCSDPSRCHRAILRRRIFVGLGATDGGEVEA